MTLITCHAPLRAPRAAVKSVELEGPHRASVHAIKCNDYTIPTRKLGRLEREWANVWGIGAARFDIRIVPCARRVVGAWARRRARRRPAASRPIVVVVISPATPVGLERTADGQWKRAVLIKSSPRATLRDLFPDRVGHATLYDLAIGRQRTTQISAGLG